MTYKNFQVVISSLDPIPSGKIVIHPNEYKVNNVSLAGYISEDTREFYIEFKGMTYGHLYLADKIIRKGDEPKGYIKFRVDAESFVNGRNINFTAQEHPERNYFNGVIYQKLKEVQGVINYFGIPYDIDHVIVFENTGFHLHTICEDSYISGSRPLVDMKQERA